MTAAPPTGETLDRSPGPTDPVRAQLRRRAADPKNWVLPVVAVVALVVGLTTTRFVTIANAKAILTSAGTIGIAALGVTLIMLCGGLVSLAIGETAAIAGMVFLPTLGLGLLPAVLLAVLVASVITAVQGWLIGAWRANPIILTIAAASVLTAIGEGVTRSHAITPASNGYEFLNDTPLGVPVVVYVLIALTVIIQFVLTRTRLGRHIYSAGENRAAARAAGLPVAWVVTIAFAIAGALIAVSAVFTASTNHTVTLDGTAELTFDAIAAVLAGGSAISGGFGSAVRTLLGALLIAAISDLLLLRGYDIGVQTLVKGVLVLVVVLLGHVRSGRANT
jgi:ribose/xylose/arabinose/galactoside ABC-type transport system permease subunit